MKQVFADTGYWIALIDPKDTLHDKAKSVSVGLKPVIIVTSEMVLVEFANFFSGQGANFREIVVNVINRIRNDPNTKLIHQTSNQFQSALTMYRTHSDKAWGLTDCVSIQIMREQGIQEVLAHDQHFAQAGFKALLRE